MELAFDGILNARDLGGIKVKDDGAERRVKKGLLLRTGELARISPEDRAKLSALGVKTVVDFRSAAERDAAPDPAVGAKNFHWPIDAGSLMRVPDLRRPETADSGVSAADEMHKLYRLLPDEAAWPYRRLFDLLADPANAPVIFHCTAGKDRTGLASALLLHALGAGREAVVADYLASNGQLAPKLGGILRGRDFLLPYMTVRESYLDAAFGRIEERSGLPGEAGINRYLREELKVDIFRLRNLYIE